MFRSQFLFDFYLLSFSFVTFFALWEVRRLATNLENTEWTGKCHLCVAPVFDDTSNTCISCNRCRDICDSFKSIWLSTLNFWSLFFGISLTQTWSSVLLRLLWQRAFGMFFSRFSIFSIAFPFASLLTRFRSINIRLILPSFSSSVPLSNSSSIARWALDKMLYFCLSNTWHRCCCLCTCCSFSFMARLRVTLSKFHVPYLAESFPHGVILLCSKTFLFIVWGILFASCVVFLKGFYLSTKLTIVSINHYFFSFASIRSITLIDISMQGISTTLL